VIKKKSRKNLGFGVLADGFGVLLVRDISLAVRNPKAAAALPWQSTQGANPHTAAAFPAPSQR